MFTKVTNPAEVSNNGRVQAQFDLISTAAQAGEFAAKHVNGNGAYFIALIPALPLGQLGSFETKKGTKKYSLDGDVSPLSVETEDGAIVKIAPTYNAFRLNHEVVRPPSQAAA